jgi:FMN reductase
MARLLLVNGAATPPGRLAAAIAFAAESAGSAGAETDVLSLADTVLDICDGRPDDKYGPATRDAVSRMIVADAVLFGAPVYRASYPGVLKNLLDLAPVQALQAKPVGILAMGGSPHHYLGVESQMKDVLQWFGALVAPTNCYVTGGDFKDGQLAAEGARKDLAALVETLLKLAALDRSKLGPIPLAARYT